MDSKKMIKSLREARNCIKNKEYDKAIKLIDEEINELISNKDKASLYVDELIENLK